MFTDQAHTYIFLAEDEARMFYSAVVEPEHLLLALTRGGNAARLLLACGVTAGLVQSALVTSLGEGDALVLGTVRRSEATEHILDCAVMAAAERGTPAASTEHILLGLRTDPRVAHLLETLGVTDLERLVDDAYPSKSRPIPPSQLTTLALRVARERARPPRPAHIPPVFERYTAQAHASVTAAISAAASLSNLVVSPFHFLIGSLAVGECVASAVLEAHAATLETVTRAARIFGPGPATQATGIFDDEAYDAVARQALREAYRLRDRYIGTGHILLAALDSADSTVV